MSAVCVLTPVVIAAWPAFSAAVVAAATSLGYQVVSAAKQMEIGTTRSGLPAGVQLEIEQSELVTDKLARDHRMSVTKEGVTITFSRDIRGKAALCVTGDGRPEEELRTMGEELGKRVVQQYVYQKLKDEISSRQFVVVEEEVDENHAIRLKVRHWDN